MRVLSKNYTLQGFSTVVKHARRLQLPVYCCCGDASLLAQALDCTMPLQWSRKQLEALTYPINVLLRGKPVLIMTYVRRA